MCERDGVSAGARHPSQRLGGDKTALRVDCPCFCQGINHCHTPLFLCLPLSESDPPAPAESYFYRHSNHCQLQTRPHSVEEEERHKQYVCSLLKSWGLKEEYWYASHFFCSIVLFSRVDARCFFHLYSSDLSLESDFPGCIVSWINQLRSRGHSLKGPYSKCLLLHSFEVSMVGRG